MTSRTLIKKAKVNESLWTARLVCTAFAALLAIMFAPKAVDARGTPDGFADLVEKLQPAVVNISTVSEVKRGRDRRAPKVPENSPFNDFYEFWDRGDRDLPPQRVRSLGSGFFISADGYVVTNNHVIEGADEITIQTVDGERFEAELKGRAPEMDLALLKVTSDHTFPFVKWADSDKARVGDWVLTIGNPFALGGSVTAGIISGRNRNINSGQYDNFIQTDAPINKGNSGGPMFNMAGEVIGVNTMIFSPTGGSVGIGFAIPSTDADRVIKQLKEYGKTRRGWLGVTINTVTKDLAEAMDIEQSYGAIIGSVVEDSPADKSGLKVSDVILKWGDEKVEDNRVLSRVVAATPIGEPVDVVVIREGKEMTVEVVTGEYPEEEEAAKKSGAPADSGDAERGIVEGMRLATVDDEARRRFRLSREVSGVMITGVDPRSDAARRGIRAGMVIAKVNSVNVSTPAEVLDAIAARKDDGKKSALLNLMMRDGTTRHVPLSFRDEDDADDADE